MTLFSALALIAAPGVVMPFIRPDVLADDSAASEPDLVASALSGQRVAQHALYVRHYERVRTRISRVLGRSTEVDDVVQDTFVIAFRDLKQLNDSTRFGSWVCGIAVHQVHRRLRRRRLLQRLGLDRQADERTLALAIDPAANPESHLMLKQLDHALSSLAPRQRIAWILRYVEGCGLEEVASQCQTSLATAKRDIAKAEGQLRAQLFDRGGCDEA